MLAFSLMSGAAYEWGEPQIARAFCRQTSLIGSGLTLTMTLANIRRWICPWLQASRLRTLCSSLCKDEVLATFHELGELDSWNSACRQGDLCTAVPTRKELPSWLQAIIHCGCVQIFCNIPCIPKIPCRICYRCCKLYIRASRSKRPSQRRGIITCITARTQRRQRGEHRL